MKYGYPPPDANPVFQCHGVFNNLIIIRLNIIIIIIIIIVVVIIIITTTTTTNVIIITFQFNISIFSSFRRSPPTLPSAHQN